MVVRWDARLGCVVKQPPDEEPPPFPKFAWRLWEVRNQLEDWHEALRTLYVACTRSEDYLILSGAMKPDYQADNAWMTTLAARFDLTTGACLEPNVAGDTPRVRIGRAEDFGPAAAEFTAVAKAAKRADLIAVELPSLPATIPPGKAAARMLTMAELEERLRRSQAAAELPLFAADDDGDRRLVIPSPLERALRTVLEAWDFRDPEMLRVLAKRHSTDAAWAADLEQLLERFAQSATCRELATAQSRQWGVEFALNLGTNLPVVQGVIDCVWQDADGQWHLLYFTAETLAKAERDRYWKQRQREIVLAATAMQRQTGTWPKDGAAPCTAWPRAK